MILFDGIDETSKVVQVGDLSESIADFTGIIAKQKMMRITDNRGELSPFSAGGRLQKYRNVNVIETTTNDVAVLDGFIQSIAQLIDANGYTLEVDARDAAAILLDLVVEETSEVAPGEFVVVGSPAAGAQNDVLVNGTSTVISPPILVSFTTGLVPRYQVVRQTNGASTNRIWLDRFLEVGLTAGQSVFFRTFTVKSAPGALRDALQTAGLGSRLGSSFAALDAQDLAANRALRFFVPKENGIKLREHLGKILELGDLTLSCSTEGVIDVYRYTNADVTGNYPRLTESEFIGPLRITDSFDKAIYFYRTFYANGALVSTQEGNVAQTSLNLWKPVNPWQPITPQGANSMAYPYLYNSQVGAQFFGDRRLIYYGRPSRQVSCQIKRSFHDQLGNLIAPQIGKLYLLNFYSSVNATAYFDEPARVIQYSFSEQNQVYSVIFEMINSPRIVSVVEKEIPEFTFSSASVSAGQLNAVCNLTIGDSIFAELFYSGLRIARGEMKQSGTDFVLTNPGIRAGLRYNVRLTPYTAGIPSKPKELLTT